MHVFAPRSAQSRWTPAIDQNIRADILPHTVIVYIQIPLSSICCRFVVAYNIGVAKNGVGRGGLRPEKPKIEAESWERGVGILRRGQWASYPPAKSLGNAVSSPPSKIRGVEPRPQTFLATKSPENVSFTAQICIFFELWLHNAHAPLHLRAWACGTTGCTATTQKVKSQKNYNILTACGTT